MQEMTPLDRLDVWLKQVKLPEDARDCITNFVLSCDNPDQGDVDNFIDIDTRDFPAAVQELLVDGFSYAYYGVRRKVMVIDTPEYEGMN